MVVPDPQPAPDPSTLSPSLIRTLVPMLAGALANWLLQKYGIVNVDSTFATALLTAVFGWLYYTAARFAEVYVSDKVGYVLGFKRKPVYPGTTPGRRPRDARGAVNLNLTGIAVIVAGVVGLMVALTTDFAVMVAVSFAVVVLGAAVWLYATPRAARRGVP